MQKHSVAKKVAEVLLPPLRLWAWALSACVSYPGLSLIVTVFWQLM